MFRVFGNTLKDETSGQCWSFSDHTPTEKDAEPVLLQLFADACGNWIDWLMRQHDPMNINDIHYVDSIRWAFRTYQKDINTLRIGINEDPFVRCRREMLKWYRALTGASDEMREYARMLYDENAPLITKSAPALQLSMF